LKDYKEITKKLNIANARIDAPINKIIIFKNAQLSKRGIILLKFYYSESKKNVLVTK
jgi:hypothetical protein